MAPFVLESVIGLTAAHAVYFAIGLAFGAVLEMAGFGWSPKLAAQFYFKDITVLKVMFTAIIVAMVLIFFCSALELLDYRKIWVNPTYLWPGIVGGLIMGVGFIIGGFCPGTSLVALATLKVDGFFFAFGVLGGIFLFGETNSLVAPFWNSSFLGRFTLPEWLGVETGWVVLGVVAMAVFMFWGGSILEQNIGGKKPPSRRAAMLSRTGAAVLFALAAATLVLKQPTTAEQWEWVAADKASLLKNRDVFITPGELVSIMQDDQIYHRIIDLRPEEDYNQFHIKDAERIHPGRIQELSFDVMQAERSPVVVLAGNGEEVATEAWKAMVSQGVINLYILEGGVNGWLDAFGHEGHDALCRSLGDAQSDMLHHILPAALGDRYDAADPDPEAYKELFQFEPKIRLEEKKAGKKGGCG